MNEKYLLKYAIDYLSKYDSTKTNLIKILKRKIFRLKLSFDERNKLLNNIDYVISILEKDKIIDDKRFSLSKINYLSNSGKSKRYIENYLISKGVNKNQMIEYLQKYEEENLDWELKSAEIFIRKKKLNETDQPYEKKLGKMSRSGFSYEICKKVLN